MSDHSAAQADPVPLAYESGKGRRGGKRSGQRDARKTGFWAELRSIFVLILAVLGFHSFIAKPFYIPTGSMISTLLVGDQLIVSKFPYGYSHVSPTIPDPVALIGMVFGRKVDAVTIRLPAFEGRLFGSVPERGDIVILTPVGGNSDYIKRVIGLPGDTIELRDGLVILNGTPVRQQVQAQRDLPVDANNRCTEMEFPGALRRDADGRLRCMVNIVRETLPNGVSYDIIDARLGDMDTIGPVKIPDDHVYLMGDNRDNSADSRFPRPLGLGGPVPIDNIGGRAEFTTLSFDGSATWNPLTWFGAIRGERAFQSLRPDREAKPAG